MLLEQGPTKMHCQGWALRRHGCSGKPGLRVHEHSRAQADKSLPCDGSTNTDITFGPSIDDDTHKSTNIITLKWSEQITKPKRSIIASSR